MTGPSGQQTTTADTRGRILRKIRVDEFQFWNILRGRWLWRPRPERPHFWPSLPRNSLYEQRHLIPPCLTGGLKSIPYGASTKTAQKLQYYLVYVKNQSLILDAMSC